MNLTDIKGVLTLKRILWHVIFCLGSILVFSPVVMYWFIHGSYERYIWIINGSFPFNSFGSGPVQLYLYAGLLLAGLILTAISFKHVNKYLKYAVLIIILLMIFIMSVSCYSSGSVNTQISKSLKIEIPAALIIEYEDSHGGFHGDGSTYAKIKLDGKGTEKAILEIKKSWKSLPLSENLSLIMYGGMRDNIEYIYNFADKFKIPHIENGYWLFIDRHSKSINNYDDTDLFNRNSFNFTLALYDADEKILYYIEFDT